MGNRISTEDLYKITQSLADRAVSDVKKRREDERKREEAIKKNREERLAAAAKQNRIPNYKGGSLWDQYKAALASGEAKNASDFITKRDARNAAWNKVGAETLNDDMEALAKSISSTYGTQFDPSKYYSQETINGSSDQVKKMRDRLNALAEYYNTYGGSDDQKKAVGEQIKAYDSELKFLNDLGAHYGQYSSPEAYETLYDNGLYTEKYQGKNYSDIQNALKSTTNDREKAWLEKNADSFMTAAEAQAEIDRIEKAMGTKNIAGQRWTTGLPKIENGKLVYNDNLYDKETGKRLQKLEAIRDSKINKETLKDYGRYLGKANEFAAERALFLAKQNNILQHGNETFGVFAPDAKAPYAKNENAQNEASRLSPEKLKAVNEQSGKAFSFLDNADWATDDEKKIYDYLLYYKGGEEAKKYLRALSYELNRRAANALDQTVSDMYNKASGLGKTVLNIGSLGMNIIGNPEAAIDTVAHRIVGERVDPNSNNQTFRRIRNVIREKTGADLAKASEGTIFGKELFGENAANMLYGAAMSSLDSLLGGFTFGEGYTAVMGGGAMADEAERLYNKGASDSQIFNRSFAAGLAEYITEKVSMDNLLKAKSPANGLQVAKEILKQAGIEGSEEMASDVLNLVADSIIMADRSEMSESIQKYKDGYIDDNGTYHKGVSEKEAQKLAWQDFFTDAMADGLAGALSGGMMSAGPTIASYKYSKNRAAIQIPSIDPGNAEGLVSNARINDISVLTDVSEALKNGDAEEAGGVISEGIAWYEFLKKYGEKTYGKNQWSEVRSSIDDSISKLKKIQKLVADGSIDAAAIDEVLKTAETSMKTTPTVDMTSANDEKLFSLLAKGEPSNSVIEKNILKDRGTLAAFERLTGLRISGTTVSQKRADVREAFKAVSSSIETLKAAQNAIENGATATEGHKNAAVIIDQAMQANRAENSRLRNSEKVKSAETKAAIDATNRQHRFLETVRNYVINGGDLSGFTESPVANVSGDGGTNSSEAKTTQETAKKRVKADFSAYQDERYSAEEASALANLNSKEEQDAFFRKENARIEQEIKNIESSDSITAEEKAQRIGELKEAASRNYSLAKAMDDFREMGRLVRAGEVDKVVDSLRKPLKKMGINIEVVDNIEAAEGMKSGAYFDKRTNTIKVSRDWNMIENVVKLELAADGNGFVLNPGKSVSFDRAVTQTIAHEIAHADPGLTLDFIKAVAGTQYDAFDLKGRLEHPDDRSWRSEDAQKEENWRRYVDAYTEQVMLEMKGTEEQRRASAEKVVNDAYIFEDIMADMFGAAVDDMGHSSKAGENIFWAMNRNKPGIIKRILNALERFIARIRGKDAYLAVEQRQAAERLRDMLTGELRRAYGTEVKGEAAVESGEGKRYSITSDGKVSETASDDTSSIKEQLRNSLDTVNALESVASVEYSPTNKKELKDRAISEFRKIGFVVDRQNFGKIEIGEKQITNSLNYLNTEAEKAALLTVPKVLKRGEIISGHKDHKGRAYSTITIAAPVEINGVRGNVAATVRQTGASRYYTHRILLPNGSEFIFAESRKNEEPTFVGMPAANDSQRSTISSSSVNSISQADGNVNRKFSENSDVQTIEDGGTVENDSGEFVAESDGNGGTRWSLSTYESSGRETLRQYLDGQVSESGLTEADAKAVLDSMDDIYEICRKYEGEYVPFGAWSRAEVVIDEKGNPVFSVVKPNGEYAMNLDFSLVCKKRRALDAVLNRLIETGAINDFGFGQEEIVRVNEIIREHGFEIACDMCFVDAKRYRQAGVADQFVDLYNSIVKSMAKDGQEIDYFNFANDSSLSHTEGGIDRLSDSELDFSEINKITKPGAKKTVEYRIAQYLKTHPSDRKLLSRGDFMSTAGFDAVKVSKPGILKLYNSKKGTGGPKAAQSDVQYLNDILSSKKFNRSAAYDVGGVRVQSFSDYVPRLVFDYVQMIGDLAAKRLPAHAYTKEPLFAKQFGLTGMKINMSLMPAKGNGKYAGLNADGSYAWARESFPVEEAFRIQADPEYGKNVGTIAVGISDEHIWKMLSDPYIRMVIPYHKSGINPAVAVKLKIGEYTDYTGQQNTRRRDGKQLTKAELKNIPDINRLMHRDGLDAVEASRRYVEWCEDNGYIPKFEKFAYMTDSDGNRVFNENYYKLLEDFTTMVDGEFHPQGDVTATFPGSDSAFGSMADLIKEGLEEDAVTANRLNGEVDGLAEEVRSALGREESGKRFSLASSADTVAELRREETELTNRIGKIEKSDAFKNAIDDLIKATNSDNFAEAVKAYQDWEKESGYADLVERRDALRAELEEIRTKANNDAVSKAINEERTAIEKSGLREADYFRKQAVKEFGHTPYFYDAGYIMPNGKMLNFSGEKGRHYGSRGQDHRAIGTIYANTNGTDALVRFMNDGNIRIMAETPGLDISASTEPSKEQYTTIRRFANEFSDGGYFAVDLSDENGKTVGTLEYEGNINPTRIVNDIKHFYETGEVREQSGLDRFRYSLTRANDEYMKAVESGDTEEQRRLVDEAAKANGYDRLFWHGSKKGGGFTEFRDWSYFTENKKYASRYAKPGDNSSLYEVYANLGNTFDTRKPECREIFDKMRSEYGLSKVQESGLPDWTDGYDIAEFIDENGLDYDSIILDEGGDLVDGKPVSRGFSYVIRSSEQVKSADPITYDDSGNVIPLTERFDSGNRDIRWSLAGTNKDGIEVYETSDNIKNLTNKERMKRFEEIMKNDYRGRTAKFIRNGHAYYATFEDTDVKKNIYGDRQSSAGGWKAKIRAGADGDIFELVENAEYDRSSAEQGKSNSAHKGINFWDYYVKTVQIDNEVYDLLANVRRNGDDSYVYNIRLYQNKKIKASPPIGIQTNSVKSGAQRSDNSVSQNDSVVNTQSMQGIEKDSSDERHSLVKSAQSELKALQKENEKLRQDVDDLKQELQLTHGRKLSRDALISSIQKILIDRYGVKLSAKELYPHVTNLYDMFYNNTVDGKRLKKDERVDTMRIIEEMDKIVDAVIENAVGVDDTYVEMKKLLPELRNTKLVVPVDARADAAQSAGFENWAEFRKANFGRVGFANEGLPVDTYYMELSERYPELFPDGITNPGEQAAHIADVVNTIRESGINEYQLYDIEDERIRTSIKNDVMDIIGNAEKLQTFADRAAQKVEDTKLAEAMHYGADIAKLKRLNTEKVADIKAENRKRLSDMRRKYQDRVESVRERYAEARANRSEKQKQTVLRNKVLRKYTEASSMLDRPTTENHFTEAMRKPIMEFLAAVDITTGKSVAKQGIYDRILRVIEAANKATAEDGKDGLDIAETDLNVQEKQLIVDSGLLERMSSWIEANQGKKLTELSSAQLEELNGIFNQLKHLTAEIKRLYDPREGLAAKSWQAQKEIGLAQTKERKQVLGANTERARGMYEQVHFGALDPSGYYNTLGSDTMTAQFERFRQCQNRFSENIQMFTDRLGEIVDGAIPKDEHGKNAKEVTLKLSRGTLTATPAQLMSVYLMLNQEDSRRCLFNEAGGVIIGKFTAEKPKDGKAHIAGKRTFAQSGRLVLNEADAAKITAALTDEQRKRADAISALLNNEAARLGNEVSMAMYGYKKYTTENYFPMRTVDDYRAIADNPNYEMNLLGLSFTKERTGRAGKALVAEDIYDVIGRHLTNMAQYNAFAQELDNAKKMYSLRLGDGTSLKQRIIHSYGREADTFYNKLINNLSGVQMYTNNSAEALSDKLLSNYKAAAVAGNVSVVLKQPMSIFRALPEFSLAGLKKSMALEDILNLSPKQLKANTAEMLKYSGIARLKAWGSSENMTRKSFESLYNDNSDTARQKINEFLTSGAENADMWTWAKLWRMSKAEIDAQGKYTAGSKEYFEAVDRKFSDVIGKTQVVQSALDSSMAVQNAKGFGKFLFAFQNEPLKQYSYLISTLNDARRGKPGAKKKLAKVIASSLANTAAVSAISTFMAWLRGTLDRDDDDELLDDLMKEFAGNSIDDLLSGAFAPVWQYIDTIMGAINSGVYGNTVERLDMAALTDLGGLINKYFISQNGGRPNLGTVQDIVNVASNLFGLPAKNIFRDVKSVIDRIILELPVPSAAKYNYLKAWKDVELTNKAAVTEAYYDVLRDAVDRGRYSDYVKIKRDMIYHGYTETKIKNAVMKSSLMDDLYELKKVNPGSYKAKVNSIVSSVSAVSSLEGKEFEDFIESAMKRREREDGGSKTDDEVYDEMHRKMEKEVKEQLIYIDVSKRAAYIKKMLKTYGEYGITEADILKVLRKAGKA